MERNYFNVPCSDFTGAVRHLGEPIKQLGYKIDDPENFIATDKAQFQVNVKGPNDKGKQLLDAWAADYVTLCAIVP